MDGKVIIGTKIDTEGLEEGLDEVKDIVDDEDIEIKPDIDTKDVEKKADTLGEKFSNALSKGFGKVGKVISVLIKGLSGALLVGILAVIGSVLVLAAALSKLTKDNEEINQQWQEIKNTMSNALSQIGSALANIFLPVIQSILNGLRTMIQYLGYILKAWFGIDIYAKKTDKSIKKGTASAKEFNKQTAGWDEMTILQDNRSGGASGGGDTNFGMIEPLPEGEVPEWLQWIADNKDIVIGAILGIVGALALMKLGLDAITAFGIGLALAGIIVAIKSLIAFLKDPTFENFIHIVEGIGIAILGVGIAVASLPIAIAGAVVLIVALVVENYDKIMGLFDTAIKWLEGPFLDKLHQIFGPIGDLILTPILYAVNLAKGAFESFYGGIKKIVSGIVKLFTGDLWSGVKLVFSGLKSVLLAPLNALISGINVLIRGLNKLSFEVPDWIPKIGGKKWGFDLKEIPKLAKGTILNNPGKGVPVANGRAIAGEAGREAYLPLSDTQLLEELGYTIGKYITINANIVNTMNGRIISKELKKISSESDFAANR